PKRRSPAVPHLFERGPRRRGTLSMWLQIAGILRCHESKASMRPGTTVVILVLLLLIAVAGIIFVVQLLSP
ncbi:MAG: hypothetical protein ACXW1Y_09015, partial [Acidimicrobiia bacterium]